MKGWKKLKTLERLEQLEPNYVHILPTAHKENCGYKVTLPPLGAELYRKVVKKYFKTLEHLEQFQPKSLHIYYLQPTKETVRVKYS